MEGVGDRAAHRWSAAAVLTALLAACGGGDETPSASTAARREQPQAAGDFFPGGPIPADAHLKGMWSPVYNWPLITVHAVLLPDGRVLSYGTNG